MSGDAAGQREQVQPKGFRSPAAGVVIGQCQHLHPRGEVERERDQREPNLVRCEGFEGQVPHPGVFTGFDAVLAARPAAVAQLEVGQLPAGGVGDERGQPEPVDVGEPQLGAGVWAFFSYHQPHPGRPAGKVDQVGDFGDPRPVADLTVGVVGGGPHLLGNLVHRLDQGLGEGEPERVLHAACVAVLHEFVGAATSVGAYQHFPPDPPRRRPRQLLQCLGEDRFVVGGGVRAGIAGAQRDRGRLARAVGSVVDERAQRMEPEPLFPGRGGVLFLAVRVEQGGVQIDDQRILGIDAVVGCMDASAFPCCGPRGGAGFPDGRQRFRRVGGQRGDRRDTVGSEATDPNIPGWVRSSDKSAAQSPPTATAIAKSRTILPGLCVARGLRHGANASDKPLTRPIFSAVRTSSSEPACATKPDPSPSTASRGYHVESCTRKVSFTSRNSTFDKSNYRRSRPPFAIYGNGNSISMNGAG